MANAKKAHMIKYAILSALVVCDILTLRVHISEIALDVGRLGLGTIKIPTACVFSTPLPLYTMQKSWSIRDVPTDCHIGKY